MYKDLLQIIRIDREVVVVVVVVNWTNMVAREESIIDSRYVLK